MSWHACVLVLWCYYVRVWLCCGSVASLCCFGVCCCVVVLSCCVCSCVRVAVCCLCVGVVVLLCTCGTVLLRWCVDVMRCCCVVV